MIYNYKEYTKFSLICSDYRKNNGYIQEKLPLKLLITIFKRSLLEKKNLFSSRKQELENIIENSFQKNSYYQSRVQKCKRIFFNHNYLANLEEQATVELKICGQNNIRYLVYESEEYPTPLHKIDLAPLILFYQGQLPSNKELEQSLAVIGSRNCEEYGQKIAHSAGGILSDNDWWNISGLATGCDTYGHWGSLEVDGLTGAVLAHGLAAAIYPPENKDLAAQILKQDGFLVSELPPSTSTAPHFFKWRDRLQSGLSRGIFIVETGRKGGTLHTANYALKQGKKVYVWEPNSPQMIPEDKIAGNLILLGLKKPSSDFKIKSPQRLTKITALSSPKELKAEFKKLQQEELQFDF